MHNFSRVSAKDTELTGEKEVQWPCHLLEIIVNIERLLSKEKKLNPTKNQVHIHAAMLPPENEGIGLKGNVQRILRGVNTKFK